MHGQNSFKTRPTNMKGFIIVVAVAIIGAQAITDEQLEKILQFQQECLAVSGVDPALIFKARQGEFVDDPKLKEHMFCFAKKAGLQNEAGEIQQDVLRKKLNEVLKDQDKTKKLIVKCAIQKDTPQQTAFDWVKCYYENSPTHFGFA